MALGKARFIAAAMLLAMLAGCGSPEEKAAKANTRFDAYYAAGDLYAARLEISKALASKDDVPDYWLKLGRVQLALGQYFPAYDAYTHVIELDRKNSEATQALAELSYTAGTFDEAEKYADRILADQPRSLRMLLIKGSVEIERDDLAAGSAIVDKMLEIDPDNEGGHVMRARLLKLSGDRAGAIKELEDAVAKTGETVAKLTVLLDLYSGTGDFPAQARTFARLFAMQPGDVDLRLEYVKLLYARGMPDRALAMLARLEARHPKDPALRQRIVDIWNDAGSGEIDIESVRRFVVAQGDDQMKVALGQLLVDQKRFADAEALLRPLIDKQGVTAEKVEADVVYAGALSGLGRGAEAGALVDKALGFDSGNPRALLMKVRVSMARNDLTTALNDAQRLVRDNPKLQSARIALADIYTRRGETLLADNAMAQAMNDLPDDAAMLQTYSAYLQRSKRLQMAADAAKRFVDQSPRSKIGWGELGRLCIQLDDRDCVEGSFRVLDKIYGGSPIRAELQPLWTAKHPDARARLKEMDARMRAAAASSAARPPVKTDAGQAARSCGKTGAPC